MYRIRICRSLVQIPFLITVLDPDLIKINRINN